MAGFYNDQHCELNDLLSRANNDLGATLLIPDLQRPYVWSPRQVIYLVDSLIRGWPFGTFLIWKVGKDDPVRELARPFWKIVDRTKSDGEEQVSKKNPPGSFQMVLDGQQRIQSLLLADCGDAWGIRMFDSDWRMSLSDENKALVTGKSVCGTRCFGFRLCEDKAGYHLGFQRRFEMGGDRW